MSSSVQCRRRVRGWPVVAGACVGVALAAVRPCLAGQSGEVVFTDAGLVSVSGEFASLRAVLEELSWQGGFRLAGFDGLDAPVDTDIVERPLLEVIRRLLGRRSYAAQLSPSGRVQWLALLGPHETARERRSRGVWSPRRASSFAVPARLFVQAFSSYTDPESRTRGLGAIHRRIVSDPAARAAFLSTEDLDIARALLPYLGEARTALVGLSGGEPDLELREKLVQVLGRLDDLSGSQTSVLSARAPGPRR